MSSSVRSFLVVLVLIAPATRAFGGKATFDSFKDPDAIAFRPEATILVLCLNRDDLSYQRLVEETVAAALQDQLSIAAVSSLAVFPPTREYTADERAQIVLDKGFRAVLTIAYTSGDTYTDQQTVMVPIGETAIATTRDRYRGMTHRFSLELLESATTKKLWISQAVADCGQFGDRATVVRNLAKGLVTEWQQQGLAERRRRRAP